ncbi:hypothetical protein F2Q69_00052321 [Brassica cretica]|uniref:Uncharacterized protein n=1 Tax=Brassica cretica TaxID=69181 RepID=A0A8S9N3P0_BRACR|nr:hypothetical protein F2Q69_00052321 [Brassica cretica]
MSGKTKDKIAVRNNAGKTTPATTTPMANAYAKATVLEKIENLAATFRHKNPPLGSHHQTGLASLGDLFWLWFEDAAVDCSGSHLALDGSAQDLHS